MNWLKIAALNLAIGVGLGAFGAHGLKGFVGAYEIEIWQTATLYLFVHALGLFGIGIFNAVSQYRIVLPAYLLQAGVAIFSGSLYAIALGFPSWLGVITPIGGTLMIIGWLTLVFYTFSKNPKNLKQP